MSIKINWERSSTVKVEKIDQKQFKNEGETEKLEYPKPPKQKTVDNITPGTPGKLEFPNKKMATETVDVSDKDIRKGPGTKEKLQYNQPAEFPTVDMKSKDESNIAKKYQATDVEKGDIKKSPKQNFQSDEIVKPETVQESKYWLSWEKAKPMQKQFSLNKEAARSYEEWMKELKDKGVNRKARRKFSHVWKNALKAGKGEEYAARAAIDSLPKEALDNPTAVHGPKKRGPLSDKRSSLSIGAADLVGFTLVSFLKWAAECPTCAKELLQEIETYQYYPAVDELKKSVKETTAATTVASEKTAAVDPNIVEALEQQIRGKQSELDALKKQLEAAKQQ